MMAAGLQRQLGRCGASMDSSSNSSFSSPSATVAASTGSNGRTSATPAFCADAAVRSNAVAAYTHLWDFIEANSAQLSTEVWSWRYDSGGFQFEELGNLPPPPGTSPTESDIRQLWSLTFLAVRRDATMR